MSFILLFMDLTWLGFGPCH